MWEGLLQNFVLKWGQWQKLLGDTQWTSQTRAWLLHIHCLPSVSHALTELTLTVRDWGQRGHGWLAGRHNRPGIAATPPQ